MRLKQSRPRDQRRAWGIQVLKDAVAIFVPFTLLFVTAILIKVPLERLADPPSLSRIAPALE